jgi:hypothetical protein
MRMKWFGVLILTSALVGACGESDECLERFGCDEPFWTDYSPAQVCRDFCGGYGNYHLRCGGTYAEGYAICQNMYAGSCDNVLTINNRRTMYELCLPWFASASCEEIASSWLPDCKNQFTFSSGS